MDKVKALDSSIEIKRSYDESSEDSEKASDKGSPAKLVGSKRILENSNSRDSDVSDDSDFTVSITKPSREMKRQKLDNDRESSEARTSKSNASVSSNSKDLASYKKVVTGKLKLKGLSSKGKGKGVRFRATKTKATKSNLSAEQALDERCKKKADKFCF